MKAGNMQISPFNTYRTYSYNQHKNQMNNLSFGLFGFKKKQLDKPFVKLPNVLFNDQMDFYGRDLHHLLMDLTKSELETRISYKKNGVSKYISNVTQQYTDGSIQVVETTREGKITKRLDKDGNEIYRQLQGHNRDYHTTCVQKKAGRIIKYDYDGMLRCNVQIFSYPDGSNVKNGPLVMDNLVDAVGKKRTINLLSGESV